MIEDTHVSNFNVIAQACGLCLVPNPEDCNQVQKPCCLRICVYEKGVLNSLNPCHEALC